MAELCESSGLHSLASLREHEKRRAQQQAEAARARAEAEQRARLEAERAEHERRLAERAARDYAESAQRAELLSREHAQRAEFERAEAVVRVNAGLEAQLESERGARRSVELGLTSRLLRQRLWTSVSTALCVAGGFTAVGLYFGALRPDAERALASVQNALLSERKALGEVQRREARSKLRVDELSSQLSSLEQTLREERERRATPPPALGTRRAPVTHEPRPVTSNVKPCRDDGDPLNPCLKR
jgi:colicin import membrane protein